MRRRRLGAVFALTAIAFMAVFASSASAYPTKTVPCSGCHGGVNVPVSATLASVTGTTATYNVSAPGATAIAVFDGSTKLTTIIASSGTFAVTTGKTYAVYAVKGPTTSSGFGSTSVSPVAPVPVDVTAPVSTSDAVATYVSSAAIHISATDAGSGVAATYYRLDGGTQVAGTSVTVTALGSHTLEFWSADVAGNVESPHKTVTFTVSAPVPVDVTAPVSTSDAVATYVSSAAIHISATDAGSGVAATYYRLDGGTQVAGTSVTVTALGSHTLEFWSADVAGNVESPHKTVTFTVSAPVPVDVTAPVSTSDAVATYVSSAAIHISATDAGSGVAATYYRLDGGTQVAGTSVTVTALGSHTLEFWSADVAGNVESPHKTVTFTVSAPVPVDVTAPVSTSDAVATYVSSAAIHISATDAGSGVAATYYRLDGGTQVAGTSVTVTALGSHTLEFWSADVAGNVESPHKTVTFTVSAPVPVDVTAPVSTSDAVATYVSSAAIHISATDAGSGVAATYYRLDGGTQVAGTSVTVTALGSHTLEFWSADVAGNVESPHKTVTFTVSAPVPVDTSTTITIAASVSSARRLRSFTLTGVLTPGSGGETVWVMVKKPGSARWSLSSIRLTQPLSLSAMEDDDDRGGDVSASASWWYRYTPKLRGTYRFQAKVASDDTSDPVISQIVSVFVR